jgi:hypothetical protein
VFTSADRAKSKERFEENFETPEARADYFRELSRQGVIARRQRHDERVAALAQLRQALQVVAPEVFEQVSV